MNRSWQGGWKERLKRAYTCVVPYRYRFGGTFRAHLALLARAERWPSAALENFRSARLRALVTRAEREVPFYRRKLAAAGVDAGSIADARDLAHLPLMDKDDLRGAAEHDLRPETAPTSAWVRHMSGGTTGLPTVFFHDRNEAQGFFDAVRFHLWARAGYSPDERALDLTWAFDGDAVRFNPYANWLSFSISQMQPERVRETAEQLERFRPRFVIGYPSTVALFAALVRGAAWPGEVKAVITGSEMLYPAQRARIFEVFPAPLHEWYGLSELAGFAHSCESEGEFHFLPQAGYVELVDGAGRPVAEEGGEGEIVLTGFFGGGTPFIRYRTGDRAVRGPVVCPRCGAAGVNVRALAGRMQDFLVAPGLRVPLSALNSHAAVFRQVWKYQFCQREPGKLVLRLVVREGFGPEDREQIDQLLRAKLGDSFTWNCVIVPDIPATARGKHKFLIQELNPAPHLD